MFVVVLFSYLYVFIILRARHDHNKIAPCGIITFLFYFIIIELNCHNWIIINIKKIVYNHSKFSIALYPAQTYQLAALYIININIQFKIKKKKKHTQVL